MLCVLVCVCCCVCVSVCVWVCVCQCVCQCMCCYVCVLLCVLVSVLVCVLLSECVCWSMCWRVCCSVCVAVCVGMCWRVCEGRGTGDQKLQEQRLLLFSSQSRAGTSPSGTSPEVRTTGLGSPGWCSWVTWDALCRAKLVSPLQASSAPSAAPAQVGIP